MVTRSIFRALWIPAVIIAVVAGFCIYPFAHYELLIRKWEAQIRTQQDPVELQDWATQVLAAYSSSDGLQIVTNKPPRGIPRSRYGPVVALMNGGWSDRNQHHLQLGWGGGFLRLWGMQIGRTNFVCGAQKMWKPGIYFFSSP
jgi:hypothetical protein